MCQYMLICMIHLAFLPAGRLAFESSISVALRVLRMLPRLAAPVFDLYMVGGVYRGNFNYGSSRSCSFSVVSSA